MKRTTATSAFVAAILLAAGPASAQDVTSDAIVEALVPRVQAVEGKPVPGVRSMRGIAVEQPAVDPVEPPSIDIRIGFAFDSADLDPDAIVTLRRLGDALADPRLADYSFMIAGHTDAKGTAEYNLRLSDDRARSVVSYLVHSMNIAPQRLQSRGYGKTQLFDPGNPEDGINRRVQIVNMGKTR